MTTHIYAADNQAGATFGSTTADGTITFQTGAYGAKVNALTLDASGNAKLDGAMQIGNSPTATNNFVFDTDGAGGMTLKNGDGTSVLAVDSGLNVTATNIYGGAYTPSLTNTSNLSSSSANSCTYSRVGNTVFVQGSAYIAATAGGSITLRLSLPIASSFTTAFQAGGTAAGVVSTNGYIKSVASTSLVELICSQANTVNNPTYFSFGYVIA